MRNKWINICLALMAVAALSGCSSIIDAHKQKLEMTTAYEEGNLKIADETVSEEAESHQDTGDAIMWLLESGSIKFDLGDYKNSLKAFQDAEKKIIEFEERADISARDAGAEAGSALTNPTAIPYRGLCYDKILLNAYKAMVYFAMNDPSAAGVELRRMRETQKKVERRFTDEIENERKSIEKADQENEKQTQQLPKDNKQSDNVNFEMLLKNDTIKQAYEESAKKSEKAYGNLLNPFATYMSAIGYLYEDNYGEACVDFRNLYRMNKANPMTNRDFVTCARRIGSEIPAELEQIPSWDYPLNTNIVFVIFANGRAPALKQTKLQIILPYVGYTGIAFPQYEYYPRLFKDVSISASGKQYATVQVSDMDAVASQEYHERLPTMITRLVISYLVKETAALIAVQAASQQGTAAQIIAYGVTGLYKYMFNTADTRCWETLPGEFQVVHFPIPEDRKIIINLPGQASDAKKNNIDLKKDSKFVIIYVRGTSKKIISTKVFEFN